MSHTVWRINGVFRQLAEQLDSRPKGLKHQQKLNYHLNTDDLGVMVMILVMIMMIATKTFFVFPVYQKVENFANLWHIQDMAEKQAWQNVHLKLGHILWDGELPLLDHEETLNSFKLLLWQSLCGMWMELFESYLDFGENMISMYNI